MLACLRFLAAKTILAIVMSALLLGLGGSVIAQDNSEVRGLTDRLLRLERALQDLSRTVYRGDAQPVLRKIDPNSSEGPQSGPAVQRLAANELRMADIESELRRLTGAIEQAIRGVEVMRERLDKLVADVDIRLATMESELNSLKELAFSAPDRQTDDGKSLPSDTSEQTAKKSNQVSEGQPTKQTTLPDGAPEEQYAHARGLLMRLDYEAAEQAFQAFIELNSQHALASNAHYWLGETYYVRQSYADAAGAFIDSYELFPNGNKAADSLLKLGMSLANLGSKDEACASFAELLVKFPNADPRLRRRALQESVRAECKT